MKFNVNVVKNAITPSLNTQSARLQALPRQAYNFFVSVTPIDTGYARSRTQLRGSTIEANYPYAQPLDRGWSRQARQGMTRPTEQFIKNYLRATRSK